LRHDGWRWFVPSAITALVVGTALTVINQSARLSHGPWNRELMLRLLANLVVPFGVSVYSRRTTERAARRRPSGQ